MPVQFTRLGAPSVERFQKSWPSVFLNDRNTSEETPFFENYVENTFDDGLRFFLRDYGEDIPSCETNEIITFCRGTSLSALKMDDSRQRKAAWLDDRTAQSPIWNKAKAQPESLSQLQTSYVKLEAADSAHTSSMVASEDDVTQDPTSTMAHRKYEGPLTAAALYRHLKEKRFGHESLPNADRRLIFISDISPLMVLALAETVPRHRLTALKDAIFKYLALQTSMRVKILKSGHITFNLAFHISFHILRKTQPKHYLRDGVHIKPRRTWRNMSFVSGEEVGILEAQISLVISGSDNSRWIAYSFVDEFNEEDQRILDTAIEPERIADHEFGSNNPIWDPREYFLHVVRISLRQVVMEWSNLVFIMEKQIYSSRERQICLNNATGSGRQDFKDSMVGLNWTNKILETLRILLHTISKSNNAWSRFSALEGDIQYFRGAEDGAEISREVIHRCLLDIEQGFDDLEDLSERLQALEKQCRDSMDFLQLRLTMESKEVVKDANRNCGISEVVLVISPFVVLSGILAISQPFGTFPRSGTLSSLAVFIVLSVTQLFVGLGRARESFLNQCSKLKASIRTMECGEALGKDLECRPLEPRTNSQKDQAKEILKLSETLMTEKEAPSNPHSNWEQSRSLNTPTRVQRASKAKLAVKLNCNPYEPHIFQDVNLVDNMNWKTIQNQLPEPWKWDIEYQTTHRSWTCTPIETGGLKIPLTIANGPVVLPVQYQWPPIAGITPPPDPRPSAPVDCSAELSLEMIRDVFLTFEGSIGFYLLTNGFLQIITPDDFDIGWALSHLPHSYGGLHVCYIRQTMGPTMFASKAKSLESKVSQAAESSGILSIFTQSKKPNDSSTHSYRLNDSIEARVKSSNREETLSGRIGLKITKLGEPYLAMSTHVITEAILSKFQIAENFGSKRDRIEKLNDDWNEHVEIWAGDKKIGTINQTFDEKAGIYPNGFKHDITLIKPTNPSTIERIQSPVSDLGWLSQESWHSLRQRSSALKILGDTEIPCSAKTLRTNEPSDILVVGEGIFLNQTCALKSTKGHGISTWNNLVSRAVLYRVYPDFDPPNGYSGVALYSDGMREDGTEGPGVVGFQSFVQRSGHVQNFDMEGEHLEKRLKLGRIAFYGAFQVPEVLRTEYCVT